MKKDFIKSDNMELIKINQAIEDAKTSYELAKSEKEATYYKEILRDLRREKQEILNNEFNGGD